MSSNPYELNGPDEHRGQRYDSFPFRVGDRVISRDGVGTIEKVWEPTIRMSKMLVNQDRVIRHPDLDPDVKYWAMSTFVKLDNDELVASHALGLCYVTTLARLQARYDEVSRQTRIATRAYDCAPDGSCNKRVAVEKLEYLADWRHDIEAWMGALIDSGVTA